MSDARPECCRDQDNLREVRREDVPSGTLVTYECQVCGRNHYVGIADPQTIGVTGADV